MVRVWRELYRRVSIFGGLTALLLTQVIGASTGVIKADDFEIKNLLLPAQALAPAPVAPVCEEKYGSIPSFLADLPDWCESQKNSSESRLTTKNEDQFLQ